MKFLYIKYFYICVKEKNYMVTLYGSTIMYSDKLRIRAVTNV